MIIVKVDPERPEAESVRKIAGLLKRGDVAAIPTETFYALSADPFSREAVEKIFAMKGRKPGKPILLLIPGKECVFDLVSEIPEVFPVLADRFWPGPLTLIMRSSGKVPEWISGGTGKIGLRVSPNRVAAEILRECRFPLTGTSANIAGEPPSTSAIDAVHYFSAGIDLVVDAGKVSGGVPSTLLDISSVPPLLVREGRISREELQGVLQKRILDGEGSEFY